MESIPSWCQAQEMPAYLQESAIDFLRQLNLPSVHPMCLSSPTIMPIGEEIDLSLHYSVFERCVTFCWFVLPPLIALAELWLRLFAGFIAPGVLCYLIYIYLSPSSSVCRNDSSQWIFVLIVCGVASSGILITDAMYVQEYGRSFGASLFIAMIFLLGILENISSDHKTFKENTKLKLPQRYRTLIAVITLLTVRALVNDFRGGTRSIDLPNVEAGLYFDSSSSKISHVVKLWIEQSKVSLEYDDVGTKYLLTGDSRTGIPFLVNKVESVPDYVRRWVAIPEDNEAVALDIAFPLDGIYNPNKPVYLVLHGLNGGSHEEYIMEFVARETKQGSTVCVMVARGLMDTPIYGENVFHGARITDTSAVAKALRMVMKNDQALVGAGYSMGAIVMANYVAQSGKNCQLDAAVIISGGIDMRPQATFWRSMRLWQPMLAQTARSILIGKFISLFKTRISEDDFTKLLRAPDIFKIDVHGITTYNNFNGVLDYYSKMSAMGDSTYVEVANGRIENIAIPMCVIHALDDPLITWRTLGKPDEVVKSGSGMVIMLVSRAGGHVGWPIGMNPSSHGWEWMNEAVSSFGRSIHTLKKNKSRYSSN